ncbi:hypothetical protein ACQP1K_03140 [Sphaerimonospora sp. CA-214678]|uniref:hypothetical protein n=1 Tax=Sphaerimonospora sp. CA-214678 TaxID=3240029 RepID=UPI003D9240A4
MGEFVGVNPVNLAELAKRLQRLHEVLARNGPIIQQKMRQWDSEVSFAQLPRLTGSALNDTRDMNARTAKAYGLARENGWNPAMLPGLPFPVRRPLPADGPGLIGPRSPYVQLDWDTTGQSGYQAEQDVQALKDALAGKDPEAVRVGLAGVREHLTQHLDDRPYLAAFWAQAGPLALQAARALCNRTGAALFSTESASILRALGSSLAAASQMRVGTGKDGRPLLAPETRAAITKSSDPWSVGMLFKYGPDGRSWDSHFLAEVTRSMLDARAAGKIQVPTPSDHGGILDQDRVLYQKRLADFDPVLAVMDRATQNGQAARHVLGDPDSGLKYAKMLVSDDWHTPGVKVGPYGKASGADPSLTVDRIDLTSHAAEFLNAAVSAPRGASDDAKESAWSVVHIVQATSEFAKLHPDKVLPHEIRQSLIYTADRYFPDFAASADHSVSNGVKLRSGEPTGPYLAWVARPDLKSFLRQALHEPKDFGRFQGTMDARISASVTSTIKDKKQNYLVEMASLYGLLSSVHADLKFEDGAEKDIKAQRIQTALSLIFEGFGAFNFSNSDRLDTSAQVFLAAAQPVLSEKLRTDNAANAVRASREEFREQLLDVKVSVTQGLINAGAVRVPTEASWFRNGTIAPDTNFNDWYSLHENQELHGQTLVQWVQAAEHAMNIQGPR